MAEAGIKLLIVDDEFNTRQALMRYLGRKFEVTGAENGSEAVAQLKEHDFALVLTDLRMPEADGMSVLDAAQAKAHPPKCIMLTAYGSIAEAVTAMKKGAFDFVTKPVKLAKLEEVISAALAAAEKESAAVPAVVSEKKTPGSSPVPAPVITGKNIVPPGSENDPMQKIYRTALAVAPSRSTVLLTGESGTGKEVVARFIHDNSQRKGLFVPVHCAALTATLLESELFGYEKGAFTGAAERRRGRFELADGGTVFLDEIGEIDAATQVKLLRVLETRSFERVGGTETLQCDLRVVAATNKDLKEMVKNGSFREDLFYRLSVINLELPPLRERRSEIPRLAQSFAAEFSSENGKNVTLSDAALTKLKQKNWPGNIRELRNCIECLAVLSPDGTVLDASDIPDDEEPISEAQTENINPLNLDNSEKELILRALEECGNNRTAAAKALGISRRTLYRKLEEFGIEDK